MWSPKRLILTCSGPYCPSEKWSMMNCFSEGSWQGGWEVICRLLTTCFNPQNSKPPRRNHICMQFWCGPIHLNGCVQWCCLSNVIVGLIFAAATECVQPWVSACLGSGGQLEVGNTGWTAPWLPMWTVTSWWSHWSWGLFTNFSSLQITPDLSLGALAVYR